MASLQSGLPPGGDPCLVVAGPTAVGKSAVAMVLAEALQGEIISVDSMQVYRGLDIGTDKSPPELRARVPHHLVDVVGLTEPFDAAAFVRRADEALSGIRQRGRQPIAVGGTGFYLKAWTEGLGEVPAPRPGLRRQLESTPRELLLAELKEKDPATYQRIDRNNPRRVIRALEVIRLTGRPVGEQRAPWAAGDRAATPSPGFFGCIREVSDMDRRIEERVERMFQRGLVDETRRLLDSGLRENPTACQAIGYRQVMEHLEGRRSLEETIDLVKRKTRQFARRQLTWFRRQSPLRWIKAEPGETPESVGGRILEAWRAGQGK